jgi:hypothetical protein
MSLDHTNTVDAVGIDRASGEATLTIADSWDWSDFSRHLLALQEKLNAYFAFIESGEIYTSYPNAIDRKLTIEIVGRYPLPVSANGFLREATVCAEQLHVEVRFRHVADAE